MSGGAVVAIAERSGTAFTLDAGDRLTVIDPRGQQVADLLAFNAEDIDEVISSGRTLGYAEFGLAGWMTIFVRGMLCNWMVSAGVVGAMISTQVSGKVIAMWMPIMLFFYMVFEHSIVNMFLFPTALIMGGEFSIGDYFIWNEIPTVLGNLVGGLTFTGLTLYATHVRTSPSRKASAETVLSRVA